MGECASFEHAASRGYTFDDQTGVWICAPGYVGTAARSPEGVSKPRASPVWVSACHVSRASDSAMRAAARKPQLRTVHSGGTGEARAECSASAPLFPSSGDLSRLPPSDTVHRAHCAKISACSAMALSRMCSLPAEFKDTPRPNLCPRRDCTYNTTAAANLTFGAERKQEFSFCGRMWGGVVIGLVRPA